MFQFQDGFEAFQIIVDEPCFDISNALQFRHEFDAHCPAEVQSVDIDFSRVELIDSSGVSALLNIRKRILLPTPVSLKSSCPSVLSILRTMRLHRIFQLNDAQPYSATNSSLDLDQLPG